MLISNFEVHFWVLDAIFMNRSNGEKRSSIVELTKTTHKNSKKKISVILMQIYFQPTRTAILLLSVFYEGDVLALSRFRSNETGHSPVRN